MFLRNVASQKIVVAALDVNNVPIDDLPANITAKISKDGAAMVATNDASPTELSAADAAGVYLFDMTQAESDTPLLILQAVTTTSGVHFDPVVIYPDNQALAAGAINSGTFANNAITTAAIAANAITSSEIADNAITQAKIANNAIGSAQMATDSIDAASLKADAVDKIADQIWNEATSGHVAAGSTGKAVADGAVKTGHSLSAAGVDLILAETGINLRQASSLILAALAGKISGAEGTVVTIKGADNSITRILATVDPTGNRSSITLTPPT